jgi:hypothetical protein
MAPTAMICQDGDQLSKSMLSSGATMEQIVSFTDYDLFAYFMVGFAAFAASDVVLGSHFLLRHANQWNFATITLIVIGAYLAGQIIALPAEWILDRVVVREVLGQPTEFLVPDCNKPKSMADVHRHALFDYYEPLKGKLPEQVEEKARIADPGMKDWKECKDGTKQAVGDVLFWLAFPVAKQDKDAYQRMTTFLKLYSFCRNMSFVAFLAAIGAVVRYRHGVPAARLQQLTDFGIQAWFADPGWQFAVFGGVGLGLFLRYLFFYRLYSVEVLIAFASSSY